MGTRRRRAPGSEFYLIKLLHEVKKKDLSGRGKEERKVSGQRALVFSGHASETRAR